MDQRLQHAIINAARREPMAGTLQMSLVELDDGFAAVEMSYRPELIDNLFGMAHGGALFTMLDEAFQAAAQTGGSLSVALNVNITYLTTPQSGARLRAEAREISATRKTATYELRASQVDGPLLAIAQAVAYRTGKPLPFHTEP